MRLPDPKSAFNLESSNSRTRLFESRGGGAVPSSRVMVSIFSSKEKMQEAIANSSSIMEAIKYLGLKSAGGNHANFKKWCKIHELNPPVFDPIQNLKPSLKKVPNKNLFVKNSPHSRNCAKKRILKDNLIPYKCAKCNLIDTWNNKPLSLQLSHKNGVNNDHRLSNLEFLCPNCHSQTPDFAGKSKNPNKHLKVDGRTKYKGIPKLEKRKVDRPSLNVLLLDVKELGYSGTGRKYGVSDNSIRKWIKFYKNIPNLEIQT